MQIQVEENDRIFREHTSASLSGSVNRINKNQYNYRDEVSGTKNFLFTNVSRKMYQITLAKENFASTAAVNTTTARICK